MPKLELIVKLDVIVPPLRVKYLLIKFTPPSWRFNNADILL